MINLRDARITDGMPRIVAEQPWAQVLSAVYGELQDRMFEYLNTGMTFSEATHCYRNHSVKRFWLGTGDRRQCRSGVDARD